MYKKITLIVASLIFMNNIAMASDDEYGLVNMKKLRERLEMFEKRIKMLESVTYHNKVVDAPTDIEVGDRNEVLTGDMIMKINDNQMKDLLKNIKEKQ